MVKFSEQAIEREMKHYRCTREEAIDILQWDYEIDHGNTELGALTKEQKANLRKLTRAERDPAEKRTVKRERKVNENKKILIEKISSALAETENLSVKNETEISFSYNGKQYTVKLTEHREKKAEK